MSASHRLDAVCRAWTREEDAALADLFPRLSTAEVVDAIGRPASAVIRRATRLGIRRPPATPSLDVFRRAYNGGWTDRELEKRYGWSQWAVRQGRKRLGLDPNRKQSVREAQREEQKEKVAEDVQPAPLPPTLTWAKRGSLEKMEVLRRRAASRCQLFHPDDAQW